MVTEQRIEARLRRLEDEREIVRALYRYAHGLDYGPEDAFLDVFTEDARWTRLDGRYGPRGFEGRTGLTKMYRKHTHAPDYFHKHVVGNPQVDVADGHATARSYLILIVEAPEGPYVRAFSRCVDTFILCKDGRWRIAERKAELESRANRSFPPAPWSGVPPSVT